MSVAPQTSPAPDLGADLATGVTAWLDAHWDPDLPVEDWWHLVGQAGWTAPHLPADQGGRGMSRQDTMHVRSLFASYGALRPPAGMGLTMAGPTILTHGTPEQIERHVPPILEGRLAWCQVFSEPGAGSDLAGLTTKAVRDGDHWVITGQKVWSSQALESDCGMLLARTDPDAVKHAGISWFAFKLDQPGVTIRPLMEMTGDSVFNEVFLDGAICDDADLIGGQGNGWAVAQTTLFFERSGIGAGGGHAGFPKPGPKGGMLGRRAGDAAVDKPPGGNLIVSLPDLIRLARRTGRDTDPHIRQKLALLSTYTQIGGWNARRGKAEIARGGGGSVVTIGKLVQTKIMKLSSEIALDILGAAGMLSGAAGTDGGRYAHAFVFAPASSIYGGTDEIQRNIVAERSLGLPKEVPPDKGVPFAEARRLQAARLA